MKAMQEQYREIDSRAACQKAKGRRRNDGKINGWMRKHESFSLFCLLLLIQVLPVSYLHSWGYARPTQHTVCLFRDGLLIQRPMISILVMQLLNSWNGARFVAVELFSNFKNHNAKLLRTAIGILHYVEGSLHSHIWCSKMGLDVNQTVPRTVIQ